MHASEACCLPTTSATYFTTGAILLLPWNALITPQYSSPNFSRWIPSVYLPATLLAVTLLAVTALPARPRVQSGFALYAVSLFLAPLVTSLPALLSLVAVAAVADALAQGAMFGLAGQGTRPTSKRRTQSLASGTSISGIFSSLLWITTRAGLDPNSNERAAFIVYFWTCAAVCGAAALVSGRWFFSSDEEGGDDDDDDDDNNGAIQSRRVTSRGVRALSPLEVEASGGGDRPTVPGVLRQAPRPLASLVLVYWITISIFPGVLQEDITRPSQWTSAVAILLYNVSDAVGKFLEPLPVSSSALVAASAARVLFIPAFIAAVGANGAVVCLLASLLGVTNGWLTITAFNALQHDVSDEDEYLAGQVAVGALMAGLNLGAASSWLLMLLIRGMG